MAFRAVERDGARSLQRPAWRHRFCLPEPIRVGLAALDPPYRFVHAAESATGVAFRSAILKNGSAPYTARQGGGGAWAICSERCPFRHKIASKRWGLASTAADIMLESKPPRRRVPAQQKNDAGWSSPVAREAHNLEVTGSNPVPAI